MKPISTFVINLTHRTDRKKHILNEFRNKDEFKVEIVPAQEHTIGSVGLWNTVMSILTAQSEKDDEYILICEDDHCFTDHYTKEALFRCIDKARALGADILSGGVSWFNNAFPVESELIWLEKFSGFQFTIIFRKTFKSILSVHFTDTDETDLKVSSVTAGKFSIFPFISTQKDFGYSDVTPKNNEPGRLEFLYQHSDKKAKAVKYIADFFQDNQNQKTAKISKESYQDFVIPTYVIHLPERTDRLLHIQEQFSGKPEFSVTIIDAVRNSCGALGLWLSFRKVVDLAIKNDDDIIIICEDDHVFTETYSRDTLFINILEAYYQRNEILLGGIGGFEMAYPVNTQRCWINAFYSTQFVVLFKSVFKKIMDATFDEKVTADGLLSQITNYKMTFFPFISVQKEFGYSDVTEWNEPPGAVDKLFEEASDRLLLVSEARNHYLQNKTPDALMSAFQKVNRIPEKQSFSTQ